MLSNETLPVLEGRLAALREQAVADLVAAHHGDPARITVEGAPAHLRRSGCRWKATAYLPYKPPRSVGWWHAQSFSTCATMAPTLRL